MSDADATEVAKSRIPECGIVALRKASREGIRGNRRDEVHVAFARVRDIAGAKVAGHAGAVKGNATNRQHGRRPS